MSGMPENLLVVKGLSVSLREGKEWIPVVYPMELTVGRGGCTGIIGESGCGKSMLCKAVLGLHAPDKWQVRGEVLLGREQVPVTSDRGMDAFRGRRISMILQEPLSAFDSRMTIGAHFLEGCKRREREKRRLEAVSWLERMYIKEPESVLKRYPFELSGGMLQRVMIALSLLTEPELLIADEPTTALDSTVQKEILWLLTELKKERGLSLLLVSHDLKVISQMADMVYVMYAGHVVEYGPIRALLENPLHPYTRGLFASRPAYAKERLTAMAGRPPRVGELSLSGCPFAPRCSRRGEGCAENLPKLTQAEEGHFVRCFYGGGNL